MTVWNFASAIQDVIDRALRFFDHVIVLDNGSSDGSIEMLSDLANTGAIELYNAPPDSKRCAGREGNFLLQRAGSYNPKWVVKLDHDEYYEDSLLDELDTIRNLPEKYASVRSYRVTLWRDSQMYRIDGRYRWYHERTMFRWEKDLQYSEDAIHHMERVPPQLRHMKSYKTKSRLVHLSQTDEQRVKKHIERLKVFDRDWTDHLFPKRLRLKPYREKFRKEKRV